MNILHHAMKIQTVAGRHSYHDITDELNRFIEQSNIQNGQLTITTTHTTCSLFFDECMHDTNFFGDEFLHVDINNILEKIVPKMTSENQYNSPGPKHVEFGLNLSDPNYPAEKWVMLNTDAHIKSSLFGSFSIVLIIKNGKPLMGELGRVYFVDWDALRERTRNVNFMLMGCE
ncbi:MAG: YjbQ family protein [Gilliamella sp.]|uniref:YjbQ family protein n=1 Tax=unclassified Gilliamella TaxID=2685620 RepID=UPI00080E9C10|nr:MULTISPECIES: YjbQ family protein [Gilliamella]MCO6549216.1 YjbQ family protein [Gilliamella sp.]MCO6551371.1 YjbQ family protein [Gilliamella sp.]OCG38476.1 secondary thiamine-phosphate synthase [Gilliamella apicola]OCG66287.1 secondary thiamine-phosphate synthase [Gilliamella apicola]